MFRSLVFIVAMVSVALAGAACDTDSARKEMVLRVQSLRNLHPQGKLTVSRITALADSLGAGGHDDYYFAAQNVLVDQLFSENRFAEADAVARRMEEEASDAGNPTARAMSHRVRGQMFYKLSQPSRAMAELDTALSLTPDFRISLNTFSTGASINEWRVIVGTQAGDTATVSDARRRYIRAVDHWRRKGWDEPSRHFIVTALAFRAQEESDNRRAALLLQP